MFPLYINKFTTVNALGLGLEKTEQALRERRSGLKPNLFDALDLNVCLGAVAEVDNMSVNSELTRYDCRNNRLAQLALQQDGFEDYVFRLKQRYSSARIAVILGTSTSGIYKLEQDYRLRDPKTDALANDGRTKYTHNLYSSAAFVKDYFKLTGPAQVISTACSSSAKVFASAARMMAVGFADAVIVGGVDSLCLNTLYGFDSLQLLSQHPCKPLDQNRTGISIGEGAGFAVLEREPMASADFVSQLLGYGESSDGFHMASPSLDGAGAQQAMSSALAMAGLIPEQIDYVNLHGTGTDINDKAESTAVAKVLGNSVPCSSTKGWLGHTLGAAGIIEAVICILAMKNKLLPGTLNTELVDPSFTINAPLSNKELEINRVLTNSFGFGGSNCSLIFGSTP